MQESWLNFLMVPKQYNGQWSLQCSENKQLVASLILHGKAMEQTVLTLSDCGVWCDLLENLLTQEIFAQSNVHER